MEFNNKNFYLWEKVSNGFHALNFTKHLDMDLNSEIGLFVYGPIKTEPNGELFAKIKAIKVFSKTEKGDIGSEVKRLYIHVTPEEKEKELKERKEYFK